MACSSEGHLQSLLPDLGRFESQEPVLQETGVHNWEMMVHGRNSTGREDERRGRKSKSQPPDPDQKERTFRDIGGAGVGGRGRSPSGQVPFVVLLREHVGPIGTSSQLETSL